MAYVEEMNGVEYAPIFGGTEVTALTANVTVSGAAGAIAKGTLLGEKEGKYVATEKGKTASVVLACDVELDGETDVVATVYTRGIFNRSALIVEAGDTVDAHENELREVGIYLSNVKA